MPDDTVTLVSTTDSPEEVHAALTGTPIPPVDEKKAAGLAPIADTAPVAEAAPKPKADAKAPADETPEQTTAREETARGGTSEKRRQKVQAEIDKLTGRKYDARRDVEAEETRLADLRRQTADLEAKIASEKPAGPSAAPVVTRPSGQDTPTITPSRIEPKMDEVDPTTGQARYPEYEDWVKDHGVWVGEQVEARADARLTERLQQEAADRARIAREQAATRAEQESLASFNKHIEAFRTSHADYDAVLADVKDVVDELVEHLGPRALSVIDTFTVRDAEDGAALMYHLAQSPDDLRRIAALPLPQQLIALGRFEHAHQEAASSPAGPSSLVTPTTRAPRPITPVGGGATASTVSPEDEDYLTYKVRRAREEKARSAASR